MSDYVQNLFAEALEVSTQTGKTPKQLSDENAQLRAEIAQMKAEQYDRELEAREEYPNNP